MIEDREDMDTEVHIKSEDGSESGEPAKHIIICTYNFFYTVITSAEEGQVGSRLV